MNIIRDLRKLDFSMKRIKEYLDHQCFDNTLALLHEEQGFIEEQIKILRERKRIIRDRITGLKAASQIRTGVFEVRTLPDRPCVRLNEYITRDEEMDFIIKKIHRKHENKILNFGNQPIGASVSVEDVKKGLRNVYRSVFFILGQNAKSCDFILPEGQYISYYYRGDYDQNLERLREALSYAEQIGCRILGDPFEIYEIDNRDTMKAEEFLTEIQIRIEKEKR